MSLVPGEYTYNFFDGWYEDGGYGDCGDADGHGDGVCLSTGY